MALSGGLGLQRPSVRQERLQVARPEEPQRGGERDQDFAPEAREGLAAAV